MSNRTRRHYRVAQKESTRHPVVSNGILIKNKQKPKLVAALVVFTLLVFLKGVWLGLLVSRDRA